MAAFAKARWLSIWLLMLGFVAPSTAADLDISRPMRPAIQSAPGQSVPPMSPGVAKPGGSSGLSIFSYHKVDKTCRAWDDGCRTCVLSIRDGAPAANCSNIGIACQPRDIKCTAHANPE